MDENNCSMMKMLLMNNETNYTSSTKKVTRRRRSLSKIDINKRDWKSFDTNKKKRIKHLISNTTINNNNDKSFMKPTISYQQKIRKRSITKEDLNQDELNDYYMKHHTIESSFSPRKKYGGYTPKMYKQKVFKPSRKEIIIPKRKLKKHKIRIERVSLIINKEELKDITKENQEQQKQAQEEQVENIKEELNIEAQLMNFKEEESYNFNCNDYNDNFIKLLPNNKHDIRSIQLCYKNEHYFLSIESKKWYNQTKKNIYKLDECRILLGIDAISKDRFNNHQYITDKNTDLCIYIQCNDNSLCLIALNIEQLNHWKRLFQSTSF